MTDHQFVLADGRKLGISAIGDPSSSRIIIVCLPTPGSGGFDPDPTITNSLPVRLIFVDRPGYGGSDPLPEDVEPNVVGFADDIAAYLRTMDETLHGIGGGPLGTVGAIGWSFGGLVALALAARHPDLVDAVSIVAAPSPKHLSRGERYSPIAEMRKHGVERSRSSLQKTLDEDGAPGLAALGISVDDPALDPLGTTSRLEHMLTDSWQQSAAGIASDRIAVRDDSYTKSFDGLSADCLFVYGDDDEFARDADARWYAKHIPTAQFRHVSGATHAVIVSEWGRILGAVAERRSRE